MSAVWLRLDSSPGCGTQIARSHPLCAGPQADKCLLNPVSPFFIPNPRVLPSTDIITPFTDMVGMQKEQSFGSGELEGLLLSSSLL